jgi:hypothetical protein
VVKFYLPTNIETTNMKLFTKSIDKKLFAQYDKGSDLKNQKVIAKIFNPYGRGTWYILNSDPEDPDYLWAITDLFEIEIGSVSRNELENIKVPPFRLPLERDMYFDEINAYELYQGLKEGKRYDDGGKLEMSDIYEKIGKFYISPEFNREKAKTFPYNVINIEGNIVYRAESKEDAKDWISQRQNTIYADGGYMAEGGKLDVGVYRIGKPKRIQPNLYEQKIVEIFENGDISTASDYGRKLDDFKSQKYPIITQERFEEQYKYAKGGYMAKGGEVKVFNVGDKVIYAPNGKFFSGNRPNYKEGVISDIAISGATKLYTIKIENRFGVVTDLIQTSNIKELDKFAKGGYMAEGGILKVDDYVWNAVGNKLIVDKVTDDEYFLIGFGQSSPSPFSKQKVDNYIKTGEWTLKPKMADGGFVVYDKNFDENGKMKITIIGKHKTRLAAKKSSFGKGYNITDMETFEEMYGDKMAGGGFLKDAKYVSKRNISSITLEVDGKSVTLKGEDLVDGVYVKKTQSATKSATKTKVDTREVANKLTDLSYDVWDKLKIESGSQIYASDATQKKLNKEFKAIGIDEIYSKLTKPERKKVSDILTDENQHSLRNYLGLRGYNGEQEYNSYVTMYEDGIKKYKRAYVLNPKNFDRVLAEGAALGDSTYLVKVAEEYAEKEYGKKVKKGAGVAKAKKVGDKYDYSQVTVFFEDGTQETFEREDFEEFFEIED